MERNEIFNQIIEQLQRGKVKEVDALVNTCIDEEIPAIEVLNNGLLAAMQQVADKWAAGKAFIPEVLIAARCLNSALDILGPELTKNNIKSKGKVVLGTVKTDLHDIGKNLVGLMLKSKGFEVIDLGVDVPAEKFVAAVKEHNADFVSLSALLTTSMPHFKDTIELLKKENLRDQVKVCVGGAPVTLAYAKQVGADIYEPDAVALAERLVSVVNI